MRHGARLVFLISIATASLTLPAVAASAVEHSRRERRQRGLRRTRGRDRQRRKCARHRHPRLRFASFRRSRRDRKRRNGRARRCEPRHCGGRTHRRRARRTPQLEQRRVDRRGRTAQPRARGKHRPRRREQTHGRLGYDGSGYSVAYSDTGVDKTHPFLAGKVVHEACFSSGQAYTGQNGCPNGQSTQIGAGAGAPCDVSSCSHGTHVAGDRDRLASRPQRGRRPGRQHRRDPGVLRVLRIRHLR